MPPTASGAGASAARETGVGEGSAGAGTRTTVAGDALDWAGGERRQRDGLNARPRHDWEGCRRLRGDVHQQTHEYDSDADHKTSQSNGRMIHFRFNETANAREQIAAGDTDGQSRRSRPQRLERGKGLGVFMGDPRS